MMHEPKAAMVAVTASAHALDAFYGKFAPNIVTSQLKARWRKNRTSRSGRIAEGLKAGFRLGGTEWSDDLVWLFKDRRNPALHHAEKARLTAKHPLGANTAQEMVAYSAESSQRAVNLMLDVFDTCTASPKVAAIVEQCKSMRHQVEGLLQLRESLKRDL
jgi:hypothetical protein